MNKMSDHNIFLSAIDYLKLDGLLLG